MDYIFGNTPFHADGSGVTWGGTTILLDEAESWTTTVTTTTRRVNGVPTQRTSELVFKLVGAGKVIDIRQSHNGLWRGNGGHQVLKDACSDLFTYGVEAIAPRVCERMVAHVRAGGQLQIGPVSLRRDCLVVAGRLRGPRTFPLRDYARTTISNGTVVVWCRVSGREKVVARISMTTLNALFVGPVLEAVQRVPA